MYCTNVHFLVLILNYTSVRCNSRENWVKGKWDLFTPFFATAYELSQNKKLNNNQKTRLLDYESEITLVSRNSPTTFFLNPDMVYG